MNRLLIVDNESYVVEGLVELFRNLPHFECEVIGAYSSKEALEWLSRTKIDIVVSDIRMPVMDGLTLLHEIKKVWPRCKVIFLSGYNDFDYVQQAIRNGAEDYVLKTDGDDVLIQAVEKANHSLQSELEINRLVEKSNDDLHKAVAALQKDFMRHVLEGDECAQDVLIQQFKKLEITLDPTFPVLLAVGRIDDWNEGMNYFDRSLMMYAVQNISLEYLDTTVRVFSIPYDRDKVIWMIQPKKLNKNALPTIQEGTWNMISRFVQSSFELIQDACSEHLKLKLSLIISDGPANWGDVSKRFHQLKTSLTWGLGQGQELLFVHRQPVDDLTDFPDSPGQLQRLVQYFETNQIDPFRQLLGELLMQDGKHYYMVVSIVLSLYTQLEVASSRDFQIDIEKLLQPDRFSSLEHSFQYVHELTEQMFKLKKQIYEDQNDEIVVRIKAHINNHLSEDLSLTDIAEFVGHNPSYLSRLFKQKSGVGIVEYITECRIQLAKKMLAESEDKIQQIAKSIGFSSVQYFYRVFKKATSSTPQEFREQHKASV